MESVVKTQPVSDLMSHDLASVIVRSYVPAGEIVVDVDNTVSAWVALEILGESRPAGIATRTLTDGIDVQNLGIDVVVTILDVAVVDIPDVETVEIGTGYGDTDGCLAEYETKADRGVNVVDDVESLSND